jgi:integrase
MKFTSTSVPNLLKGENGTYYLRARICGRLIWRSLETDTYSVAKLLLADKLSELRKAVGAAPTEVKLSRKITFGEAVELYKAEVNSNSRLKPRAKQFRLRSELTFRRTWSDIFNLELRRISPEACKAWLMRFESGDSKYLPPRAKAKTRPGNSPTTVNAAIAFLQHVFAIGIKSGLVYRNPAKELERKPARKKLLRLPNRSQFAAIVAYIRRQPGWGRIAGDLVEGLAYSGMRVGESRRLTWSHLDFEKGLITIPGEKTENAPRIVPMTADFRRLVETIKGDAQPAHEAPVFRAQEVLGSLATACKKVGVPHLTHHDLRHLFATTCIESGVDVPTVALWLGHADGGALAMRTYGHIRPEHSVIAAKKVSFSPPAKLAGGNDSVAASA